VIYYSQYWRYRRTEGLWRGYLDSRVCHEAGVENNKADDLNCVPLSNGHERENNLKNPLIRLPVYTGTYKARI